MDYHRKKNRQERCVRSSSKFSDTVSVEERGMFKTDLKALQMVMGRTDWLKRAIMSSDTSVTYVTDVRFTNVNVSRKL